MLFRGAVEASLPPSVQTTLKSVVGLPSQAYTVWATHVTQYIDNKLEKQEQEKKDFTSLQAQLAKSQLREMRDKVNQNKASAKKMPQQAPPTMQSQPPITYYGPYPDPPPYPHRPAILQSRPMFNNRGGGRFYNRSRPGPKSKDQCYQCGGHGHWANQCQARQYSRLQRGTPQYDYNMYPPPQQVPPQTVPPPHLHQGNWHQAPGIPQLPQ